MSFDGLEYAWSELLTIDGCVPDDGCIWEEETYPAGYQLFIDECNYYECMWVIGPAGDEYVWSDLITIDGCGEGCIDMDIENFVWLQTEPDPTPVTCEYLVSMFDCDIYNSQWMMELDVVTNAIGPIFPEMFLSDICCESCQEISIIENTMNKNLINIVDILGRTNISRGFQLHIYDDGTVEKKYIID